MQPCFIAGFNSVSHVVRRFPGLCVKMYCSGSTHSRCSRMLEESGCKAVSLVSVSAAELDGLVPGVVHQGVVLAMKHLPSVSLSDLLQWCDKKQEPCTVLILDQVQDPQNVGACLRSAAAFGVEAVIVPDRNAVAMTTTVAKVSCGACALVPLIVVPNLVRAIEKLKAHNFWVYAASERGESSVTDAPVDCSVVWVMGSEEKGIRPLVQKHCDRHFVIDVSDTFTTLNVATATGICLHQTFLRRKIAGY